jgi:hypothetical protein
MPSVDETPKSITKTRFIYDGLQGC